MKKICFIFFFLFLNLAFSSNDIKCCIDNFCKDSRWADNNPWSSKSKSVLTDCTREGSYAYATDFVKFVYNKDNIEDCNKKISNINDIQSGDVINFDGHYICVIKRDGNYLYTIEGNAGGYSPIVYKCKNGVKLQYENKHRNRIFKGWNYEIIENEIQIKFNRNGKESITFNYCYRYR